jgi:hypothetical protein
MVCWIEGGAGFFLFRVLPGGAVELAGRSRAAPGVVDLRRRGSMSSSLSRFSGWRSRSLSLGGWSPKTLARRISTCSGRLGGAAAARPARADGEAAGGAVADSTFVIYFSNIPVRDDDGARAIGANDDAAASIASLFFLKISLFPGKKQGTMGSIGPCSRHVSAAKFGDRLSTTAGCSS